MSPQEYLDLLKSTYKTYTHLKMLLTTNITINEFNDITKQVIEQINSDSKDYFNYRKENNVLPVIEKEYNNLTLFSNNLLQYLYYFKNLVFS